MKCSVVSPSFVLGDQIQKDIRDAEAVLYLLLGTVLRYSPSIHQDRTPLLAEECQLVLKNENA